jgi:hypothetical protein
VTGKGKGNGEREWGKGKGMGKGKGKGKGKGYYRLSPSSALAALMNEERVSTLKSMGTEPVVWSLVMEGMVDELAARVRVRTKAGLKDLLEIIGIL